MSKQTKGKLGVAKKRKDDEFYTPMDMIVAELEHYPKRLFKGKKILCNCDDPGIDPQDRRASQFFLYFNDRFEELGLKQLVGIRYAGSTLFGDVHGAAAYTRKVVAGKNGKKRPTPKKKLRGDTGGFGDREGLRQLADCDIVITNPPFSRFREFIDLLMAKKKKFIVIGNVNAPTYDQIFPLIQSGKMWIGTGRCKGKFIRPNETSINTAPCCWFTNLPHERRENGFVPLTSKYSPRLYPTYDNYPAIDVGRVADIPCDYNGEMGVPITFLLKHNPKQFEIVEQPTPNGSAAKLLGGRIKFSRLIIKRVKGSAADWIEIKDLSRRAPGNAAGFVYVATTGDVGWYKIGMTNGAVKDRVKRGSFSRKPPKVLMALMVHNARQAEGQVHKALAKWRASGTEFFNPSRETLEKVLSRLAKKKIRLWQK